MQHATVKFAASDDDRNKQAKALQRWEAQKAEWDRLERNLARKVGKPSGDRTLQGSTHEFRMRTEELGMIDASVPAEVKNGVSAWEMNLRASSGGVRYVQVGSSYPYPLYCPIRDAESVKPDNHILMKVVPKTLPVRNKPVATSEFFQSRQNEFQKHIKRKFQHYQADFFEVEGTRPPLAGHPVPEDSTVTPVTYHPIEKADGEATVAGASKQGGTRDDRAASMLRSGESPVASRPLSAVMKSATPGVQQQSQSGPMIVLSSAHLHFSAAPSETAQATLRIENTGTTAVFYSWSNCDGDAALPLSPTSGSVSGSPAGPGASQELSTPDCLFKLSDVPNAVLLPDDCKYFTVSFRSAVPGIFSQLLELLTVPAGRERIIIHLRAVVVGGEGNGQLTGELEHELAARAGKVQGGALLNEIVYRERDNAFDAAALHAAVKRREAEIAAAEQAELEATQRKQAAWEEFNEPFGIPYHPEVYGLFDALHRNIHSFAVKQARPTPAQPVSTSAPPSRAPTPGAAVQAETKVKEAHADQARSMEYEPWTGAVRDVIETASTIRDPEARSIATQAVNSLVAVGSSLQRAVESGDEAPSFNDLLWAAAGRQAWGAAADRIQTSASTAKDVAEGRATVKSGAFSNAKATDKGSKAAPKGKPPAGQPVATAEINEKGGPEADAVFFTLARRCVSDAISGMIDFHSANLRSVQRGCRFPIETTIATRLEDAINVVDPVMEPLVDANAAKGKKK
jgi:hypothetical protein